MSEAQRERLTWWVEIVWKVSTPVMVIAWFWLKSTFATTDQLQTMADRLTKTETAILLLTKDNEVNTRQDATIGDHETRIRVLERVRAREKQGD